MTNTYLIGMEGSPLTKIGKAGNPLGRLANFQTGAPGTLTLLWTCEGDYERALHKTFKDQNVRGEWFDLTPLGDPASVVQAAFKKLYRKQAGRPIGAQPYEAPLAQAPLELGAEQDREAAYGYLDISRKYPHLVDLQMERAVAHFIEDWVAQAPQEVAQAPQGAVRPRRPLSAPLEGGPVLRNPDDTDDDAVRTEDLKYRKLEAAFVRYLGL